MGVVFGFWANYPLGGSNSVLGHDANHHKTFRLISDHDFKQLLIVNNQMSEWSDTKNKIKNNFFTVHFCSFLQITLIFEDMV